MNSLTHAPDSVLHKRAFTLIELLAVIAVTGVLTGILFAGIRSARESADRASCASNLRQLGAIANLYAQENGGNFPETGLYNRGRRTWDQSGLIDKLGSYAQDSFKVFYCPAYTLSSATNSGLRDHTYDVQFAKSDTDSSRYANISYFWNVSRGGNWNNVPLPQSLDGDSNRVLASCVYFFPAQVQPHGGKLNFLFADGHVENRSRNKDVWSDIDRSTLLFK